MFSTAGILTWGTWGERVSEVQYEIQDTAGRGHTCAIISEKMPNQQKVPVLDADCVAFLQWALPQMGMRWAGFRTVRRQVCRRVQRRMRELALANFATYRAFLDKHLDEWQTLDSYCRITISRFYRDRSVFELFGSTVLPELADQASSRDPPVVRVWSAGCGSGEEPYTVALLWEDLVKQDSPDCSIRIIGTDSNPALLHRAREAQYPPSVLRDIPERWRDEFEGVSDEFSLMPRYRAAVSFAAHDLRSEAPRGPFDAVLCRNLAFTYWDKKRQLEVVERIEGVLRPGGYLVIGAHEELPQGVDSFAAVIGSKCVLKLRRRERRS